MKIIQKSGILAGLFLVPALFAQQGFDFKLLDGLRTNAKNSTSVSLDASMLKLAANFLGTDRGTDKGGTDKGADSIKSLISGLTGVYVRSYEFDKAGQYSEATLAPLYAFLRQSPWAKIVESSENGESSEIYAQPLPNDRLGALAIVSLEAKEVTVVYIQGAIDLNDVGKLGGTFGIPEIKPLRNRQGKAKKDN